MAKTKKPKAAPKPSESAADLSSALTIIAYSPGTPAPVAAIAEAVIAGEDVTDKGREAEFAALGKLLAQTLAECAQPVPHNRLLLQSMLTLSTATSGKIRSSLAVLEVVEQAEAQRVLPMIQGLRMGLALALGAPNAVELVNDLSAISTKIIASIEKKIAENSTAIT